MSVKLDPALFSQFPFLKDLIGEETFNAYGAEVDQGMKGDGVVTVQFGPMGPHGRAIELDLDQSGEIKAMMEDHVVLIGYKSKQTFSTEQVSRFISTLFTPYELRKEIAVVPKGHRFDVSQAGWGHVPDGKITHRDLWKLATDSGKSLDVIAREVSEALILEGLMNPEITDPAVPKNNPQKQP